MSWREGRRVRRTDWEAESHEAGCDGHARIGKSGGSDYLWSEQSSEYDETHHRNRPRENKAGKPKAGPSQKSWCDRSEIGISHRELRNVHSPSATGSGEPAYFLASAQPLRRGERPPPSEGQT